MNDMESRKFEAEVKRAFQGAEVEPSENAWTNIELELEKTDSHQMKRKVFFYKMLAAASVTFALCVAGVGYYTLKNQDQFNSGNSSQIALQKQDYADNENISATQPKENSIEASKDTEDKLIVNGLQSPEPPRKRIPTNSSYAEKKDNIAENSSQISERITNESTSQLTSEVASGKEYSRTLPRFYDKQIPVLSFSKKEESVADPVALMFARLNDLERELSEKKDEKQTGKDEKLWTSIGFAAGGFNTANPSVSARPANAALMSSSSNVLDRQSKISGVAYSAGVSVGTSLSERWVLQGGINYLSQLSDYTANEAFGSADFQSFKAASLNEFRATESQLDSKIISTAPYTVNNNVQFISMPVQAGYLFINKRFGWQLNAGIATDLFLQNTIDPENGSLDKVTQGRGDDSPYRPVNFSGLFGTELSYKFGQRYRLALNPGLRYPFNSIYKSDLGIQSMPLTIDVGLRFRYIFQ